MSEQAKPPRPLNGVIYEPKGRALEYSLLACNLYGSVGPDGRRYPAGCVHGCDYCYVPASLHIPKEIFHGKYGIEPRENILERLEADAEKYRGTDKRVLLCFSCDPYQPIPSERDVTRRALEILRAYDIPFQVLTKGGRRAERDFDLYGPHDAFATTLTLTRETASKQHEPKAAGVIDRLAAIKYAKKKGITTWVSLEPVLDSDQSLQWITYVNEYVDLFKIGTLNHQASDIDWRAFGIRAIELCEEYGVKYTIKVDLARHLDGVEFHNTDTRCVVRGE